MSIYTKAFDLAAQGASNSEIFAELELTPGALKALLLKDGQLTFSIVQGRRALVEPLIVQLQLSASEDAPLGRSQLTAIMTLLERADKQNSTIMIAQDLILLQGLIPSEAQQTRDSATVTQLLRAK